MGILFYRRAYTDLNIGACVLHLRFTATMTMQLNLIMFDSDIVKMGMKQISDVHEMPCCQ